MEFRKTVTLEPLTAPRWHVRGAGVGIREKKKLYREEMEKQKHLRSESGRVIALELLAPVDLTVLPIPEPEQFLCPMSMSQINRRG